MIRRLFKLDTNKPFSLLGLDKRAALAIQKHFRLSNYQMFVIFGLRVFRQVFYYLL